MKLQQLLSKTRQAVQEYHMIQAGDHIAVGVSGGKDSLALLYVLSSLSRFYPEPFTVSAVTVDLGFGIQNMASIKELCEKLGILHHTVETRIKDIICAEDFKDSPCYVCSKIRKAALNGKALEIGCNKIAYAHHKDDVVETMLLSLLYEGRFHTFEPVTPLDDVGLTLIRPFLFIKEGELKSFINKQEVAVLKSSCPVDGTTKREYVKQLLRSINADCPGAKDRMFTAIRNSGLEGWETSAYPMQEKQ